MDFDAIILAGGRSSRLGGVPKCDLVIDGRSLLQTAIEAVPRARAIVVVGENPGYLAARPDDASPIRFVREVPRFGGPASAIAAGLAVIDSGAAPAASFTAVLACDMPHVARAVEELVQKLSAAGPSESGGESEVCEPVRAEGPGVATAQDGVIAEDGDGRTQYLAAIYATDALRAAVARREARGGLEGVSVRALVEDLSLKRVAVRSGATDDVDTWSDAERYGATRI
jgi:molybdopterin-guanine dinucleotide biosynthesis protein A